MAAIIFILTAIFAGDEMTVTDWGLLVCGTIIVMIGMTLFLFGADMSMMNVGREAGKFLVSKGAKKKKPYMFVLGFSFMMGALITIAEPDVRILAENVFDVSNGAVSTVILMGTVGIGVGVFVALSILRIAKQWRILTVLGIGYIVIAVSAVLVQICTDGSFIPVAFDSGGVTTGPLTVPFFLAFSGGVVSNLQFEHEAGDQTFGIVGLASIGPIIAVLLLGGIFR